VVELPSWVPDDEAKPAPMPLLLVQSFVNTWESDSGVDLLADRSTARPWLVEAGLLDPAGRLTEDDLETVRSVREGIRSLLVLNAGGPPPSPAESSALRTLARSTWVRPELAGDGHIELVLEGGDAVDLGRLLLVIRDAQHDGTWARLKACHDTECRWAFYDRSHARRGTWCDMAVCGNRAKNRTLRSRRSTGAPAIPEPTSP
jgi:predicted RNA-binding Zn ribbon-like protein